jgi:hypothetical protein
MDESQVEFGKEYRDTTTGFVGKMVGKHEYLHGCTRVTLQAFKDGDIKEYTFDAPALESVEKEEPVTSGRTGGPRPVPSPRPTR